MVTITVLSILKCCLSFVIVMATDHFCFENSPTCQIKHVELNQSVTSRVISSARGLEKEAHVIKLSPELLGNGWILRMRWLSVGMTPEQFRVMTVNIK